MKILIVDDEPTALKTVQRILRRKGWRDCDVCDSGAEALKLMERYRYDIVLLDIIMPGTDGLKVLETAASSNMHTEFIMLTAVDDTSQAVRAVKLGAYDYLVKPVENDRMLLTIERAYERKAMKAGLDAASELPGDKQPIPECFTDTIAGTARMRKLLSYADIVSKSDNPILIYGESGTGKELLARGIHRASRYCEGPFVPVNMASIPESLFESYFFGHVKGAFTGSNRDHLGYFQQADGGTLFLDEVGDLPLHLQPKLLRVLEDKTFNRVGESEPIRVDVRIVSATNMDLDAACRSNAFRPDLLFRLKCSLLTLPPLRERAGDIPLLAEHFMRQAAAKLGKEEMTFSPEAMRYLASRQYPGNIRELSHLVANAVIFAEGKTIHPRHLEGNGSDRLDPATRGLYSLRENEYSHILYVLRQVDSDRKEAARILGLSLRQLQRKVANLRNTPGWRRFMDDL